MNHQSWDRHVIQEMEKIHIILCKVIALYKLTTAICEVDNVILSDLQQWFEGLPITRSISLKDIQQTMCEQQVLVHRHHELIDILREDMAETSNVNASETAFLLELEQEDGMDKVASEGLVVKNQLQLFSRYYALRTYLYAVDAHEAITIQDTIRLEMLEKRVNLLNDLIIKLQLKKELDEKEKEKEKEKDHSQTHNHSHGHSHSHQNQSKSTKKEKEKEKSASMTIGLKEVKRRIRTVLGKEQYFNNKQQQQRGYSRRSVIEQVNTFLVDLNKFLHHLTEQHQELQRRSGSVDVTTAGGTLMNNNNNKKKKANLELSIALTTRIDQLHQVSFMLQAIVKRAALAPPMDRTSYKNVSTPIIPPHGLIVHVENKNALAWGQVVIQSSEYDRPHPHSHYVKTVTAAEQAGVSNEGKSGSVNGDNEEEEIRRWRPLISFDYPYHTVKTLHTSFDALQGSWEEAHPIFAVFHHIVKSDEKVAAKTGAGNVVGDATEEQQPVESAGQQHQLAQPENNFVKETPTHIALFKLQHQFEYLHKVQITAEHLDSGSIIGHPIELTKAADKDYTEIDLKQMFGDQLPKPQSDDDEELQRKEADEDRDPEEDEYFIAFVAKDDKEFKIVEDSPVLHMHISENLDDFEEEDEDSLDSDDDNCFSDDESYFGGNSSDESESRNDDDEEERSAANEEDGEEEHGEQSGSEREDGESDD
jgi:hypothetical protein